ncbi:MAG: hypothetical protein KC493_08045 [Bacteriovoracaceae bacterium]|nr:hypothetical protein [Bacteriovoracaceae bacterium]
MEESLKSRYKVFRGAYSYLRNGTVYSEESFEVFKEKKEGTYTFEAELHSRVATGQLLTIKVSYSVNKDYIPTFVVVEKFLGEDVTKETWNFDSRKNTLFYSFLDKDREKTEVELTTSPKFHITTPAACCAMLFLRSKKFDGTAKNTYSFWSSDNKWVFDSDPAIRTVAMTKISTAFETIVVDEQKLQAIEYRLFEDVEEDTSKNKEPVVQPYIRLFQSKHVTIPYMIRDDEDGTKIQIKYLNDLEGS